MDKQSDYLRELEWCHLMISNEPPIPIQHKLTKDQSLFSGFQPGGEPTQPTWLSNVWGRMISNPAIQSVTSKEIWENKYSPTVGVPLN